MRFKGFYILVVMIITSTCYSQNTGGQVRGKVTFITSQNVYVKFDDTENINVGDTLKISRDNSLIPCLVVTNKSSSSCVCSTINDCDVKKDDTIAYEYSPTASKKAKDNEKKPTKTNEEQTKMNEGEILNKPKNKESISGRISASSYSNMSSVRSNSHRMMYSFSLDAEHIGNSKFSLETYLNYRHNFIPKGDTTYPKHKFFNVYNLAIRYDVNPTFSLTLGRKINNNASSLGAFDGLQAQKFFGKFFTGIMVGFRPDMFDYGFNKDLFQYSGFIGVKTDGKKSYSRSTLGYMEQRNAWKVDRRYVYFQHSSSIRGKLSFFSSAELDLFNQTDSASTDVARLTSLYVSARYQLNRIADFNVSYDTRKQILYYETFKSDIEQRLQNDESKQGLRLRVNVRPYKYINIGLSYSRRFQKDGSNKSNNINGSISWSKVLVIGGRLSAYFNMNKSNYLNSKTMTFRYSRYLFKNKLSTDIYFRRVYYDYLNNEIKERQNYYGANIAYYINKILSIRVMGEIATRPEEKNYRINTGIIARFYKKKKKLSREL